MPAPDEPKLDEPLALPLPDAPALPGLAEPGVSSVWVPEDIPAAVQPGFAGFSFRPVVELPLVDVPLADEPLLLLLPVPLLPDVPVPEFGDELVVPALFEPLLLPALPGAAAGPAAPAAPEAPPLAPAAPPPPAPAANATVVPAASAAAANMAIKVRGELLVTSIVGSVF